jgi:hypothetical protein
MKEKISVKDFVNEYVEKKIMNNKINPNAVEDYIRSKLDITEYLPFSTKREIVEMLVGKIVYEEDGIKRVDSIAQFLAFIVAMVASHTTLEFSDTPEEDYDALSQSGVLEHILALFAKDYSECDALLKAAIADELADNNLNVIVSKFLNGVLGKLDCVLDIAKGFTENIDLSKLLGTNMNEEDMAKIIGLVDKLK